MRALGGWVTDWRNIATVTIAVLVGLLCVVVADGRHATTDALATAREATANQSRSSQAATRRIDLLTAQNAVLQAELDAVLAAKSGPEREAAVTAANAKRATTTTTSTTVVKPSRGVARTRLDWAALRNCESGGNYANKSNVTYRGAYQFSRATWASVGGSGDPADATPAEQDDRAALLFQRGGRGQWPICGRLL